MNRANSFPAPDHLGCCAVTHSGHWRWFLPGAGASWGVHDANIQGDSGKSDGPPDMSTTFEARLDILPESQRRLWPELDAVPSDFVLYGGTGLALQLGHRVSEDFDFFSSSGFHPARLRSRLPFFQDLDAADPDAWVHFKTDN